ncbi:MAG: acetylxylan esterase [Planctomycetales bacterium]|nr:acetylxylan esterase [Planctomycetales bacterium]
MQLQRRLFSFMSQLVLAVSVCLPTSKLTADSPNEVLSEYFAQQTARLEQNCLSGIESLEDWETKRSELRQQLLFMLGLHPLPEKTPLQATVTGQTEHDEFTVEHVHFQSRPGLYVTGNLYLPKKTDGPLPAILYVCGHASSKEGSVSHGNKTKYHHHGSWFARNGYVCLTIDSLQLGEIEATHHGTYRYDMWWWLNRGYSPAGVEAWNCVRALDYLQSRSEVDPERLGVTGRSGGGAYSWWIAAIDDRIKVAVPVAGITDLQNHVVDGCVEGHCDCMFMVNTFQWDYPAVAALVAPRPLLISNTDRDSIFPLEGVVRTHAKVRSIYQLYGADEDLALHITAGPHKDTQELRIHAFRWFNKYLKGTDELIHSAADSFFEPHQLTVFRPNELPTNERNTTIHDSFVPEAVGLSPGASAEQKRQRQQDVLRLLQEYTFRAWPEMESEPADIQRQSVSLNNNAKHLSLTEIKFQSQSPFLLPMFMVQGPDADENRVVLHVMDEQGWTDFSGAVAFAASQGQAWAAQSAEPNEANLKNLVQRISDDAAVHLFFASRGVGPTKWEADDRKQVQIRRRFYLLGQTLDGMRIFDLRRAIRVVRSELGPDVTLELAGSGKTGMIAAYASLFEPTVRSLSLQHLPDSHRNGPTLLNVSRFTTWEEVMQLVKSRCVVKE